MKTETFLFIIAALAIIVMGAVLAAAVLIPNGAKQAAGQTYVSVSATGTAYGSPTTATIYVMTNGTGQASSTAAANLSHTLSEFNLSVAKYTGGNLSQVSTTSYSINRYKYNNTGPLDVLNKTGTAYVATETVTISLHNSQNVTALIGSLSLIPNVYINNVASQLSSSQVNQLTKQAVVLAMQNATSQAQAAAGNNTIRVDNITISKAYVYPFYPYGLSAVSAGSAGLTQNHTYYAGNEGVQEQVSIVFSYR